MQIKITFSLLKPLTVPLAHQRMLQAFIYRLLIDDEAQSVLLHDNGYDGKQENFTLFCFGPLTGKNTTANEHVTFTDTVTLELRSVSDVFCSSIIEGLYSGRELHLGNSTLLPKGVVTTQFEAEQTDLNIRMVSPVSVKKKFTEDGRQRMRFLSPLDSDFARIIDKNFKLKYRTFYGAEPSGGIEIKPADFSPSNRYFTEYKPGVNIIAWNGDFVLKGKPEHLRLLYDLGIGAKNAAGFGMFQALSGASLRIIEERGEIQ